MISSNGSGRRWEVVCEDISGGGEENVLQASEVPDEVYLLVQVKDGQDWGEVGRVESEHDGVGEDAVGG